MKQQKSEGWDLLKVQEGLSVPAYDAMAKTAKEVGIRFGGHVPSDVGLLHAMEMGQETFDHIDGYIEQLDGRAKPVDDKALQDLVQRTKKAGAGSTMVVWETLLGPVTLESRTGLPELRYMPATQVEQWTKGLDSRLKNPQYNGAGEAAHRQSHEDPEGAARQRGWRAARQRRAAAVQRARLLDPSRDAADGRRGHRHYEIVKSGTGQRRSVFKARMPSEPSRSGSAPI